MDAVRDGLGNLASARAYQQGEEWQVAFFGYVAVGNGRHVFGFVNTIWCASRELAEQRASEQNAALALVGERSQ